jgi:hypothetical protein
MLLKLPRVLMHEKNSRPILYVPYPVHYYGVDSSEEQVWVLKVVAEEIEELVRRYAILFPDVLESFETETYVGHRCMVHDEDTGITRQILEKLGFELEESEFSPYKLYWITLKTRTEKRKKK